MPVYYVSRLARENGVIVCQVGEGADELFCGYDFWSMMNRLQKLNNLPVPRLLKKAGLAGLSLMNRSHGFEYEWLRRGAMGLPPFWGGAESFTHNVKKSLVPRHVYEQFSEAGSWESIEPIYRRFQEKAPANTHLDWMTYIDLNNRLPELLLMRVDKMSMASSLEARVPFLDHRFVELAMSIPSDLKVRNGVGKYIMRKAVRNTIPDAIIDRTKQGFGLPLHDWFEGEFLGFATDKLKSFCSQTRLLNFDVIEGMLNGKNPHAAWPLLNLAMWWDCYFAQREYRNAI
jgi:asparagine synthase (glutamine-hydrolysing)